jgi:hypothetical protein
MALRVALLGAERFGTRAHLLPRRDSASIFCDGERTKASTIRSACAPAYRIPAAYLRASETTVNPEALGDLDLQSRRRKWVEHSRFGLALRSPCVSTAV